uniref:Uncharacterized protein n=1 Tax=Anopheles culicifacies TaxID=139723 RepID=A0A182M2H8_9DIPT
MNGLTTLVTPDNSIYTPFNAFYPKNIPFECANVHIMYENDRLRIALYCPIQRNDPDQRYVDVYPSEPDLQRVVNKWIDCHRTTYRVQYEGRSRAFYMSAEMLQDDGNSTSTMFMAANEMLAVVDILRMKRYAYYVNCTDYT